jgi:hypothetical protein
MNERDLAMILGKIAEQLTIDLEPFGDACQGRPARTPGRV